jgi:PAS domain-containing protein
MKVICAWCLKDMGFVEESVHSDTECLSHGICSDCKDNIVFQQGVSLQRYIDSLAIPILVVDSNVMITAVNLAACKTLGKKSVEIVQRMGGDVFECERARLPEGCGKTIHCSGCTIRRTVVQCFTSGEPQIKVSAYVNPDGPISLKLSITAIKVGASVLLRIEHLI